MARKKITAILLSLSIIGMTMEAMAFEENALIESEVKLDEKTENITQDRIAVQNNDTTEEKTDDKNTDILSENVKASENLSESEEKITIPENIINEELPVIHVGKYNIKDSAKLYENFDYSDPQYITDELLFGKWDSVTESWIPQDNKLVINNKLPYPEINDKPLIDYSYSPELKAVENAVKECDGNYAKPKALLLKYYQNKFKNINKDVSVDGSKRKTAIADALAYNYVTKVTTPITLFDMEAEKSVYEFDVGDEISKVISGNGAKQFCFIIDSIELDKKTAFFSSSESINKPYLKISLTDGTDRILYPNGDATLKGGKNKNKSFAHEEELYAKSRDNVNVENDNSSNRILVRFDLSEIPDGTRATGAQFGITGWTDKTEGKKRISLGSTNYITWNENNVCWAKSQLQTEISYDTLPGMQTILLNYYNLTQTSSMLASRYLYDRDEIYAYHGIRYMLTYHKNIDTRPFVYNDFLAIGFNGGFIADGIYSFIESKYMTPENFAMLLKSVYCNTEWIQEGWNTNYAQLHSNHATYYNRGFGSLITLFTEFDKADDELQDDPDYKGLFYGGRGGWIPCLQRRVLYKAKEVSFPDGAGKEVSGGYNMEAYANTVYVLQYALEADMPELLPEEYYDIMAVAAVYFVHGMAPGYRDWYVGNSYGYGSQFINRPVIKIIIDGLKMLLDNETDKKSDKYKKRKEQYEQLMFAYTAGVKGIMPETDSILYPIARKAVMRNGWDKNDVGATVGISNGGIHGHFDDLSIVIAGYGRYLLADSGKDTYETNGSYRGWFNSTRAHNTIEINDISQRSGYWSSWEVVKGPSGEDIVLPFRGEHGIVLSGNVISDLVNKSENSELKKIFDDKNYTKENLKKIYDFDNKAAADANPNIRTKNYQGRFLESEMNKTFDYIKGETYNNIGVRYVDDNNLMGKGKIEYKGLDNSHNRSVLFVKSGVLPAFYIVTDCVAPVNDNKQMNKYSQGWHFTDDADITLDENSKIVKTHFPDANIQVIPVIGKEVETKASIVDGWYHSNANVRAEYVTYVKENDKPTTFNTILLPMDAGVDYDANVTQIQVGDMSESDASAFSFDMQDTQHGDKISGVYYNLHKNEYKNTVNIKDYKTDARLFYADEKDGYTQTAVLADATLLQDKNNEYLVKADSNITYMGIEWKGDAIYLSTSQVNKDNNEYVEIERVTIKNLRNVNKVFLNDKPLEFRQKGKYIYFGDAPLINDDTEEKPEIKPEPDKKPDRKPSSNHGGGGGGSAYPQNKIPQKEDNKDKTELADKFNDELYGHWGEKEIKKLVNDGIVTGKNDTLALKDAVTRAEFIALLVRISEFEIQENNDVSDYFDDVKNTDWYAPYIYAAYKNGIVEGDGKNIYPEKNITREEMAKMIYGVLKYKNIPEGNSFVEFGDINEISNWAKESVRYTTSTGILKGMEDNKFMPKENTLREQAFIAVYRLMDLIRK